MIIVFYVFFVVAGVSALFLPWIGVAAAYLIAILNPQVIWFWLFDGFRPALFVTAPLLIGLGIQSIRGKTDWTLLKSPQILWLLVLIGGCALSTYLAPYSVISDEYSTRNSMFVLEVQAKIIFLVAVGCLCINSDKALRAVAWMFVGVGVYLTYWANARYFELGWVRRLAGPMALDGTGIYADENNFAAFFVAAFPFIWFMGHSVRNRAFRWALWAVIPLCWHAIFLTGSRGGLLGVAAVLLCISIRAKSRVYGVLLIAAFALAFSWQAGDTMKERAASIDDYAEDDSASSRLDSWQAATLMMIKHPLSGVGPGAYLRAFPDFSERVPLQAHNTYFQVGAEYGPLSAMALILAIITGLRQLWSCPLSKLPAHQTAKHRELLCINEATLASICGLGVCSLFLTLQLFEPLYFLVFLSCVIGHRSRLAADSLRLRESLRSVNGAVV